jgi:hypothetical protein
MRLVLLSWIVGSGLFFAGWVLGVIMAKRHGAPTDGNVGGLCEACYFREIEAQLAEPASLDKG